MWESLVPSKWSTRSPGGPLFTPESLSATDFSELSKWKLEDHVLGFRESVTAEKVLTGPARHQVGFQVSELRSKLNAEIKGEAMERSRRRRPTYSAKFLRAFSKGSEESVDSGSEPEEVTASARDLMQTKILEFRRSLTHALRIKTALLSEKVVVMCSKDGKHLEWYKVRSEEGSAGKKIGYLVVAKITDVIPKSDNNKNLEIFAGNASYLFLFKSREAREAWQSEFNRFRKFMDLDHYRCAA